MITEYISKVMQFHHVPPNKYENCPTREQWKQELQEKRKDYPRNENGPMIIDAYYFHNFDDELFAGDHIIGFYNDGTQNSCCLYTWKENNNPKEIVAYSLLNKFHVTETIGDVEIIEQVVGETDRKRLLLTI